MSSTSKLRGDIVISIHQIDSSDPREINTSSYDTLNSSHGSLLSTRDLALLRSNMSREDDDAWGIEHLLSEPDTPTCEFDKRYNFVESIASGGQGRVDLYAQKTDLELVAVKTQRHRRRMKYEEGEWRAKASPCTLTILDQLKQASSFASIMQIFSFEILESGGAQTRLISEYCNGGDLHGLKARCMEAKANVPERFIWYVFWDISRALFFLHEGAFRDAQHRNQPWKPIIHRDIKPGNVLLKQNPEDPSGPPICKLADFDLAMFYSSSSRSNGEAGTYVWQPPEQWADPNNPHATPAGDIWALGAIIQFLATKWGHITADSRVAVEITPYQRLKRLQDGKDQLVLRQHEVFGGRFIDDKWKDTLTHPEHGLFSRQRRKLDRTRPRKVLPITNDYSFELHCWMCKALDFDPSTRASARDLVLGISNFIGFWKRTPASQPTFEVCRGTKEDQNGVVRDTRQTIKLYEYKEFQTWQRTRESRVW